MKTIKTILVAITLAFTFYACSEEECNDNCYEAVTVENMNRICSLNGCRYTHRVMLKNVCTGELQFKTTLPRKLADSPKVGDLFCGNLEAYK